LKKIKHRIAHSEIRYGNIKLTKKDGVKEFFRSINNTFDANVKGKKIYQRSVGNQKIWMGREIMRKFNPNDVMTITKKGRMVFFD